MEPAVSMAVRTGVRSFPFLRHGTSLETRDFGEVSSRGSRPYFVLDRSPQQVKSLAAVDGTFYLQYII